VVVVVVVFVQNCSLEIQLKDLVINRKLILRWILKKYVLSARILFIVVVIGSVESVCGPCDKSSILMSGKELVEKLSHSKI
jgi:hypothetical protein